MAARTRRIRLDSDTRLKIQASQLINRLTDHVFGKVDMSATQVRAAEALLRKTLPDLSSVDHTGEVNVSASETLTMANNILRRAGIDPNKVISDTIQ